jgi:hypothetical protein
MYVNDIEAIIGGEAVPLGITNVTLTSALIRRPKEGKGVI